MQIIRSVVVGIPILIAIVALGDDFQVEGLIPSGVRVCVPGTATATLPAPLRESLVLRQVHELSYREIAGVAAIVTNLTFIPRQRHTEARNKLTPRPVFAC